MNRNVYSVVAGPDRRRSGFTLLELLTVVAIVSVLSSLLLTSVSHAKAYGKITSCRNNLRQLTVASLMYADDDRHGSFSGRTARNDQDLNWLLSYVGATEVFSCPATRNVIRSIKGINYWTGREGLVDLIKQAGGRKQAHGSSYIGYGFFAERTPEWMFIPVNGRRIQIPNLRRSLNNVAAYRHHNDAFGLAGRRVGPAEHWIMLDGNNSRIGHFPDEEDNHGARGSNVGFCDGHVEWVKRSSYLYRYELSQDANRTKI